MKVKVIQRCISEVTTVFGNFGICMRHSAIVGLESPSRVGHGTCMHGSVKLFKNLKNF